MPAADEAAFARDMRAFIAAHTRVTSPPLVPELKLFLADEITPLWRATERYFSNTNIKPPFWAFAWPGGIALARHILDHPDLCKDKRVLDFASGSGIVALAAARAGAVCVTAADIDPVAHVAIAMNAELNKVSLLHEKSDIIGRAVEDCDLILAGDFCYEWPMAGYAVEWLRAAAAAGREVLFADPARPHAPRLGIEEIAHFTIPTTREVEDSDSKRTTIYRLLPEE